MWKASSIILQYSSCFFPVVWLLLCFLDKSRGQSLSPGNFFQCIKPIYILLDLNVLILTLPGPPHEIQWQPPVKIPVFSTLHILLKNKKSLKLRSQFFMLASGGLYCACSPSIILFKYDYSFFKLCSKWKQQ